MNCGVECFSLRDREDREVFPRYELTGMSDFDLPVMETIARLGRDDAAQRAPA
jgi:hypothetical protein